MRADKGYCRRHSGAVARRKLGGPDLERRTLAPQAFVLPMTPEER